MSSRSRLRLDALYARCVLATLGGLLILAPAVLWLLDTTGRGHWPAAVTATCLVLAACGTLLASVALSAGERTVNRWADAATTHEVALVPMLLAWPLYRLVKALRHRG